MRSHEKRMPALRSMFFTLLCVHGISAQAVTASNNLGASVIVPAQVQVIATNLSFATAFDSRPAQDATAVITVNMVATQPYNITLDAGLHAAGGLRRTGDGAGNARPYQLFKDASLTQQWGDSDYAATYSGGSSLASAGTGANQNFTVYGHAPATSVQLPPGTYTDVVTITINY